MAVRVMLVPLKKFPDCINFTNTFIMESPISTQLAACSGVGSGHPIAEMVDSQLYRLYCLAQLYNISHSLYEIGTRYIYTVGGMFRGWLGTPCIRDRLFPTV